MNLDGLMHLTEHLHDSGVKILTVNAVYDSGHGYEVKVHNETVGNLWCGLAQSEPYRVDPSLGGEDGLRRLVDTLHSRNMALMTWFNPSYFWTGSPYFKQAEEHMRRYGLTLAGAPADSPARWFKWRGKEGAEAFKPPDSRPLLNGKAYAYRWIWDEDANASYFSVWADQPSTDFASPAWQRELGNILRHWIDQGIDGFVLDDPDGYISAGNRTEGHWQYAPEYIRRVTFVVREAGRGRVATMAELYGQPQRATAYGLDASFDHDYPEFRGTKLIAEAFDSGNMSLVEQSFAGPQAVDAIVQQRYFAAAAGAPAGIAWQRQPPMLSWLPGADRERRNGYWCSGTAGARYALASSGVMPLHACFEACRRDARCDAVGVDFGAGVASGAGELQAECFLRGGVNVSKCAQHEASNRSTFSVSAPEKMRLLLAVDLAAGYLTVMEQSSDGQWWSNAAWPGSSGEPRLGRLHRAVQTSPAFGHTALRLRLGLGPAASQQYALLRYDATDESGSAAIAVFNFAGTRAEVGITLPKGTESARGQRLRDDLTGEVLSPISYGYAVSLPPFGYRLLSGMHLPRWERLSRLGTGFLNCYQDHGASWAPAKPVGEMPLAACFLSCLGEQRCRGVTVGWGQDRSLVECYLRGDLDASRCQAAEGRFSTYQWSLPLVGV